MRRDARRLTRAGPDKALVAKALDLQKKFTQGQTAITMETMTFLRDWLQHHILESDKMLGKFLSVQGVR